MTPPDDRAAYKRERDVAIELLADVLAQATTYNASRAGRRVGRLSHAFISAYQDAFEYFGITTAEIDAPDFYVLVAERKRRIPIDG